MEHKIIKTLFIRSILELDYWNNNARKKIKIVAGESEIINPQCTLGHGGNVQRFVQVLVRISYIFSALIMNRRWIVLRKIYVALLHTIIIVARTHKRRSYRTKGR